MTTQRILRGDEMLLISEHGRNGVIVKSYYCQWHKMLTPGAGLLEIVKDGETYFACGPCVYGSTDMPFVESELAELDPNAPGDSA